MHINTSDDNSHEKNPIIKPVVNLPVSSFGLSLSNNDNMSESTLNTANIWASTHTDLTTQLSNLGQAHTSKTSQKQSTFTNFGNYNSIGELYTEKSSQPLIGKGDNPLINFTLPVQNNTTIPSYVETQHSVNTPLKPKSIIKNTTKPLTTSFSYSGFLPILGNAFSNNNLNTSGSGFGFEFGSSQPSTT